MLAISDNGADDMCLLVIKLPVSNLHSFYMLYGLFMVLMFAEAIVFVGTIVFHIVAVSGISVPGVC